MVERDSWDEKGLWPAGLVSLKEDLVLLAHALTASIRWKTRGASTYWSLKRLYQRWTQCDVNSQML